MSGNERVRACALCKKNVYNLSSMSAADAQALIAREEGTLCVRLYRRADGTVLTDECPVGLRAWRRRARWIGAGVAAVLALMGLTAFLSGKTNAASGSLRSMPLIDQLQNVPVIRTILNYLDPVPRPPARPTMGVMCVRPVPPRAPAQPTSPPAP